MTEDSSSTLTYADGSGCDADSHDCRGIKSAETGEEPMHEGGENQPFLTEDDVVQRYRGSLSAGTLRNWRSKGLGPPYMRIGKAILYAREDLERWEASCRNAGRKTGPDARTIVSSGSENAPRRDPEPG